MAEPTPKEVERRKQWFESYVSRLETDGVWRPTSDRLYPCPCCASLTLGERGGYEICPVCFWEDDGQDDPHADEVWGGPNGRLSLTSARENYRRIGASEGHGHGGGVRGRRPPSTSYVSLC